MRARVQSDSMGRSAQKARAGHVRPSGTSHDVGLLRGQLLRESTSVVRNGRQRHLACRWNAHAKWSLLESAEQADAQVQDLAKRAVVSTDPPYYDNIGYADLSDFFYVWLRRSLRPVFPDLFATLAVPKAEELVATPYRHGSKEQAETFFLDGMTEAMHRLAEQAHPAFPVTIYYAFKQAESETANGHREHWLGDIPRGGDPRGFAVSGTWPMRTELSNAQIEDQAPTPSPRASSWSAVREPLIAATATRREFVTALKAELPKAHARPPARQHRAG